MRYVDTGSRDANQTLSAWLQSELSPSVAEVRWQAGFFTSEPLGLFAATLRRLAGSNGLVNVLIGSNDSGTLRDDVLELVQLLGLPRPNVRLGVVQYSNAFFHPKTYHFRRNDGSQCAYVGSANLTGQGVSSLHVEAGVLLDTRNGDPVAILDAIAAAVDDWFATNRDGLCVINDPADVHRLVTDGVLAIAPPPRPPGPPAQPPGLSVPAGPGAPARPRLRPLVSLPPLLGAPAAVAAPAPPAAAPAAVSVNRPTFPAHVFFDPVATGPTSGTAALSGQALPAGANGLVIRLTRDDTRLFAGGVGTANINLPVESMPTLRFGVLGRGGYPNRPRAEFDLLVRYIGARNTLTLADPAETNVMLYGYLQGESGHQNRRMLLPADVRDLAAQIQQAALPLPGAGHFALMEWPTPTAPEFRLSFLEPGSPLFRQAQQLFTTATNAGQLVGDGACWLPPGVSPVW